jgi:hypothetical protein
MNKYRSIIFASIVIVVSVVALLVGCKKEKVETTSHNNITRPNTHIMLNYINHFMELRDAQNSGKKIEGTMTVNEMRQTLSLIANYEHSEHETHCGNTTLDTLYIAMPPVDRTGAVNNSDVIDAYNAFEKALQGCIDNTNDGNVIPSLFSVTLPQVESKENDKIRIVFTRGKKSEQDPNNTTVVGPIEDLCLVWGLDGGLCNPVPPINYLWDAADELSTYFIPVNTNPGNGVYQIFTDVEYVEYIATETFMVENTDFQNYKYWIPSHAITPCTYWLFYLSGIINGDEPCLCEDEMNCEWYNINRFIVDDDGELHFSTNLHCEYYSCTVLDHYLQDKNHGDSICDRYHTARVCYADYFWIGPGID